MSSQFKSVKANFCEKNCTQPKTTWKDSTRNWKNCATVCAKVPCKLLPSIAVYTRISRGEFRCEIVRKHSRNLAMLSEEQERPLFNVKSIVVLCGLDKNPPSYIIQTLSLGPEKCCAGQIQPPWHSRRTGWIACSLQKEWNFWRDSLWNKY